MTDLFYSFGNQHPGAARAQQLPALHAGAEHPRQPGVRHGRGRHPARARARRSALQRVPAPARAQPDPQLRRPHRRHRDRRQARKVYGDDLERREARPADRHAGREAIGPTHFGFGETMFQIFILNASRRLQADRFYTDDYREEVYTAEGMAWVDEANFKTVLLRHYPELAATGLGNIKNAFEPWDTEAELDPDRHPLRAYDPELKNNPVAREGTVHPAESERARRAPLTAADARSPPIQAVPLAPRDVHRERIQEPPEYGRWRSHGSDHLDVEPWHRSSRACSAPSPVRALNASDSRSRTARLREQLVGPLVSQVPARRPHRSPRISAACSRGSTPSATGRAIWPQAPGRPARTRGGGHSRCAGRQQPVRDVPRACASTLDRNDRDLALERAADDYVIDMSWFEADEPKAGLLAPGGLGIFGVEGDRLRARGIVYEHQFHAARRRRLRACASGAPLLAEHASRNAGLQRHVPSCLRHSDGGGIDQ